MRVYVASKFEEGERVREVQRLLLDLGHDITYDWTRNMAFDMDAAMLDTTGVCTADALVLLLERDHAYKGAWVEMGMALALNKPVIVIGPWGRENIFLLHPLVSFGWDAFYELFGTVQEIG